MDIFNIFKNLSCSNYCTDNEFEQDNINNNNNTRSWNLYLKEYEMYSAMILYNNKLNKDINNFIINHHNNIIFCFMINFSKTCIIIIIIIH